VAIDENAGDDNGGQRNQERADNIEIEINKASRGMKDAEDDAQHRARSDESGDQRDDH
jgi:hypothetical protein